MQDLSKKHEDIEKDLSRLKIDNAKLTMSLDTFSHSLVDLSKDIKNILHKLEKQAVLEEKINTLSKDVTKTENRIKDIESSGKTTRNMLIGYFVSFILSIIILILRGI